MSVPAPLAGLFLVLIALLPSRAAASAPSLDPARPEFSLVPSLVLMGGGDASPNMAGVAVVAEAAVTSLVTLSTWGTAWLIGGYGGGLSLDSLVNSAVIWLGVPLALGFVGSFLGRSLVSLLFSAPGQNGLLLAGVQGLWTALASGLVLLFPSTGLAAALVVGDVVLSAVLGISHHPGAVLMALAPTPEAVVDARPRWAMNAD